MTTEQFDLVATGGTFDEIHAGHRELLIRAFELGRYVLIGVSSDNFAEAKKGKNRLRHRFETRVERLVQFIHREFGDVNFEIKELNDDFGPTSMDRNLQALVVSEETEPKGHEINRIRLSKGFDPLVIVIVTMLKAEDGQPLSSSRIRLGEIDRNGRVLRK
ncbi:MAG: phosphopantetheine adenylyltransferase [Nitrososphaeraceae archaeon]